MKTYREKRQERKKMARCIRYFPFRIPTEAKMRHIGFGADTLGIKLTLKIRGPDPTWTAICQNSTGQQITGTVSFYGGGT